MPADRGNIENEHITAEVYLQKMYQNTRIFYVVHHGITEKC